MKNDNAEKIWHCYRRLMMYIANGFFGDPIQAEDAVSDAFERIMRSLDRFEEIPSQRAKGLVIIITKNCCRDIMRKSEYEAEPDENPTDGVTPADIVISAETVRRITACIERLNGSYADILRLKLLYEMSDADIARTLGITPQNARTRLCRARNALEREMKKEGL